MIKGNSSVGRFCRENKLFSALCAVQAALILWMVMSLFAKPVTVALTSADLARLEENAVLADNAVALGRSETAATELGVSLSPFLSRPGAYTLTIRYESCLDPENPSYSVYDDTGYCAVYSLDHPMAVSADVATFYDGRTTLTNRFWVGPVSVPEDLRVDITRLQGLLKIYSVTVQEQPIYRLVWLTAILIGTAVIAGGYWLFLANGRRLRVLMTPKLQAGLALTAMVLFASLPLFADFLFLGHDLTFHLERIIFVAEELGAGQFPVRMQTGMFNGYGYASSLYYCDLFLYFPALLYRCMLPLRTCYQLYAVAVNAATALTAYGCFLSITKERAVSLTGAAVYLLSPYRMANLYLRAAVGEYTAMIFMPLVILGLYEIYRAQRPRLRQWLPLALGAAGIVQSHVLSTDMTAIFVGLVFVCQLKKSLRWERFKAFFKAGLLAAGLSLWYWLPMLRSLLSMKMKVNGALPKIQAHGVYLMQLLGVLLPGGGASDEAAGMSGKMPLGIGLALLIGLGLTLYCMAKRGEWALERRQDYRLMRWCFTLGCLAMAFTLRVTPWDNLESVVGAWLARLVLMVQFSWRFLAVATVLLSAAATVALRTIREHAPAYWRAAVLTVLSAVVLTAGMFTLQLTQTTAQRGYAMPDPRDEMEVGSGEYLLSNVYVGETVRAVPQAEGEGVRVLRYEKIDGVAAVACENTSEEAGRVILPIFAYDHYAAYDEETGESVPMTRSDHDLLMLELPPGYQGTMRVRYEEPALWRAAEAISLLCAAAVILTALARKRQDRRASKGTNAPCDA